MMCCARVWFLPLFLLVNLESSRAISRKEIQTQIQRAAGFDALFNDAIFYPFELSNNQNEAVACTAARRVPACRPSVYD